MAPLIQLKGGQYVDPPTNPSDPRTILLPLEGRDGYAFAVCVFEVKRVSPDANLACRMIEEHVERLANGFGKEAHPQHRFEQFLAALNESLAEVVRSTEWKLPIASLHAVVGVACDQEMYLSGTGDLTALFLHRTPSQRYQVFNLSRGIRTEQALPTWEKTFAVILDGDLHPGDVFCLASKDLAPVIENDELCSVLAALPPVGAAAKIRQYFPHSASLSILVLRMQGEEAAAVEQARPRSEISLEQLEESRRETERLLEDESPHPTAVLGLLKKFRSGKDEATGLARPGMFARLTRSVGGLFSSLRSRLPGAQGSAPKEGRAEIVRQTREKPDRSLARQLNRLKDLPRSSRYLALGALVLLLAIIGSVSVLSRGQASKEENARYQEAFAKVGDLREQAAAAAIYRDEAHARALYQDALAELDKLPTDRPERASAAAAVRAEIGAALDTLRHVVHLPEPPVVASFDSTMKANAITFIGPDVYAFLADKRIVKIDTAAKTATPVTVPPTATGAAAAVTSEGPLAVILDDRPGLSTFDKDASLLQALTLVPDAGTAWKDLIAYNSRLYVLQTDANDGQVFRFPKAGSSYGAGSAWIKSKTSSLKDAVSLAVDGGLFVLKSDGNVVRFLNGGEAGWNEATVDPALTSATDLWTDLNSDFVYILDATTHRIVVFDKDSGAYVTQYESAPFSAATGLLVDEKNKTVYVLTPDKLYGFRASHLP